MFTWLRYFCSSEAILNSENIPCDSDLEISVYNFVRAINPFSGICLTNYVARNKT